MIERCTKKRMLFSIVILIGLSIAIVLLEHHFTKSPAHSVAHIETSSGVTNKAAVEGHPCLPSENYSVIEECHPCTDFEKTSKSFSFCEATGYKEKIKCQSSGDTYKSCDRVLWLEERRFWTLEIVSLILGLLSSSFVIWRQRLLEHQTMQRIQRQINFN